MTENELRHELRLLSDEDRAAWFQKMRERWTARGRESGFPECCITFFCYFWPGSYVDKATFDQTLQYAYLYWVGRTGYAGGYIPCPACLRTRLVLYKSMDPKRVNFPIPLKYRCSAAGPL